MESLTRNNYEIWFIDYLDGQLNRAQIQVLQDFLEENPDLRRELSEINGTSLVAGSESVPDKDSLLRGQEDIPGISTTDQLCIARMEDDLSPAEASRFDTRLQEDESLSASYEAFLMTRLDHAIRVSYPDKGNLLKKTRVLTPWIISAISTAAIIILAIFLWPDSQDARIPELAGTDIIIPDTQNQVPENPVIEPQSGHTAAAVTQLASNRSISQRSKRVINSPANGPVESVEPAISGRTFIPMNRLSRRQAAAGPGIPDPQSIRLLYASNYPVSDPIRSQSEESLTVPQYALQLFRERILGQERSLVRSTRFSLWEVAGAGVDKFNDIAGTRMKLEREYDATGSVESVSFNARLFDVETPVRGQDGK